METTEETHAKFSQHDDQVWSVKQSVTGAEIIETLQFSVQNVPFSSSENLAHCHKKEFPDSVIVKNISLGPAKILMLCHIVWDPTSTRWLSERW